MVAATPGRPLNNRDRAGLDRRQSEPQAGRATDPRPLAVGRNARRLIERARDRA
jgi:hypothetical protein